MTRQATKEAFEKSNKPIKLKSLARQVEKDLISEVGNAVNDAAFHASFGLMTSWEELIAINPHLLINPQEMSYTRSSLLL